MLVYMKYLQYRNRGCVHQNNHGIIYCCLRDLSLILRVITFTKLKDNGTLRKQT